MVLEGGQSQDTYRNESPAHHDVVPHDRLTIAIPYVDGPAYLRDALESALAQGGDGWRVVVCDNTIDAEKRAEARRVVEAFGDPRASFAAFESHVPICESFNRAMQTADGDLVALLHADDRLLPGYSRLMFDLARRHPQAAAYFCGVEIMDEAGAPSTTFVDWIRRFYFPSAANELVLRGEPAVRALANGNFIGGPTVCFRLSRLGGLRWPTDLRQAADLDLWTRILFAGGMLVGTRSVGYRYRRHGGSSTSQLTRSLYRFEEEVLVHDRIAERADALGWHDAARVARRMTTTRLHLLYLAALDTLHFRFRSAATKIGFSATLRR
jgi:glycosyltransferase involved in cell wall biosynthesis